MRKARSATTLTENDLAARLRLDVRLIEALEADDYDALPAPMFVKGYIRSIAKELDVQADPIIAAYDFHAPHAAPMLTDFDTRAPIQITSSNRMVKGVTFGVGIVLILMVGLWWNGRYADRQGSAPPADLATAGGADTAEPADSPPTPLPYSYPIVEHPAESDFSFRAEPTEPSGAVTEETDLVAAGPPAGEIETPVNRVETNTDQIVIEATEDAWVEVNDGAGERLFYGLAKPGVDIQLSGQPPYALVIGNSEAVTISYRGRAVDLAQFSVQGVARFELD